MERHRVVLQNVKRSAVLLIADIRRSALLLLSDQGVRSAALGDTQLRRVILSDVKASRSIAL